MSSSRRSCNVTADASQTVAAAEGCARARQGAQDLEIAGGLAAPAQPDGSGYSRSP
ncbi:hypothetical protein NVV94_06685 [Pseudomonas sp. LS1212]|uniref:hypothetical protein n=1 Tax=Pseudomonas sp. LS1212 TaxID=2972478 RepID=UPI00215D4E44|nr:hypothetical protein [Pseudomonas sp. LS1212]UVJ45258.1 hypothetical protein NVV94_06685 [Pseudomonas sp. LS1212]